MDIIYEDKNIVVVDKLAGVVVHVGAGETGPTLVDWLLEKYPEIKNYQWPDQTRPGIVHRLDKDTSGVIVLAKNPQTLAYLQEQFRDRTTEKTYLALVLGKVEPKEGVIKSMIGRDKFNRLKQRSTFFNLSWQKGKTRPAETGYKVINSFIYGLQPITYNLSLLEVKPKTGRMHQIRVHLKQEGWPIIGDQVYNTKESKKVSDKLGLNHQFLHAKELKISIPDSQEKVFTAKIPNDLQTVLDQLE